MKVAVIGSRNFNNYQMLKKVLDNINIELIVSGGAIGADQLGEKYANKNKIKTLIFKPDWKQYGRGAGFIRNKQIIENCDCVYAFWDGKSKGTKHSIELAKKLNKTLNIILYEEN